MNMGGIRIWMGYEYGYSMRIWLDNEKVGENEKIDTNMGGVLTWPCYMRKWSQDINMDVAYTYIYYSDMNMEVTGIFISQP